MTEPLWIFVSPWGKLILFGVSNVFLIAGLLMIVTRRFPPPFQKARAGPVLGTASLLVGLTMLMYFGTSELFADLRMALLG